MRPALDEGDFVAFFFATADLSKKEWTSHPMYLCFAPGSGDYSQDRPTPPLCDLRQTDTNTLRLSMTGRAAGLASPAMPTARSDWRFATAQRYHAVRGGL